MWSCVLWGGERSGGLQFFFLDRAIRSAYPVEKVDISTGYSDRIARAKRLGSKRHFFDCVRMPDLVSDRNSPFSIHRSNRIRIGLRACPERIEIVHRESKSIRFRECFRRGVRKQNQNVKSEMCTSRQSSARQHRSTKTVGIHDDISTPGGR